MKLIFLQIMLLFVFSIFAEKKLEPINNVTTIDSILLKLKIEKKLQKKIELHFLATEIYSLDTKFYSKCYFHLNQVKNLISYVKNNERKAKFLLRVGTCFMLISDNSIAISYMNSALLVVNGLKVEDKVLCYNRLGILYSDSNEEKKAIDSYNKGISLILKSNKKNGVLFETLYNNIAISYMDSKLLDSAMYYLKTCLKLRLKRNDFLDIGQSYNNIGSVLFFQEKYDSSLFYFKKGYTFRINSKKAPESSICESEINISKALIGLNKFREAEILLKKNYTNSFKLIHSSIGLRTVEQLMNLYVKNKKYQKALFFTNKYFALKDSMYSLGSREEVIRQNLAFQYKEKIQKDSIISIQKEKRILLEKKKEAEIQKQKNREQKIIFISLIIVLLFMSGIIFLVVRGYINKKRVSESTLLQNYKLEKINKEITDSITYAKRIQSAILPSEKLIKSNFPDSFILYKPKDIVAGDFYWFEVIDELIFFAVADCTGHGVPGAMVSVICHNALNRSVKEHKLKKAGEILDKTREIVIAEFEKSEEDVKDGMDISLCVFNMNTKSLNWSGANNPLWIIRKNADAVNEQFNELTVSLVEFKADKQPIGKFAYSKLFTTLEINLYKGDEIYMFTDGFQDQFGGEKGKKFKALKMREMLLSINQISMNEKKNIIDDSLEKWKGNLEQVDDVCIIGVRI